MLTQKQNKPSEIDDDRSCETEKNKIENIQVYFDCSKTMFENSLKNEKFKKSSISDFILHEPIGMGAFGRVLLVHHKSDKNTFLAMKVMKKEQILRKNQLQHVLNEKNFLSAIRHPFIIHLEYYATDLCHIYFMMPFIVGGDLFSLMRDRGVLDEFNAKFYAGQLVLALEFLHMLDILYRDLKPENVLINKDGFLKITDLGLSKRISKKTMTMCGTPQYLAPEIILIKSYGKPVDWWALGVVIFEMVAGILPFSAENERNLFKKIVNGSYRTPHNFSPDLSNIVENFLQTDVTKRFGNLKNGTADIKQHRWFRTTDWIALYNKQIEAPFIPSFNSPSDTKNFEKYSNEEVDHFCNTVDEKYFENF